MNITGIIAEYNPFHNGHAFHLQHAREETAADYLIVVLSGNFVQRGAPALLDKFTRAEMALCGGADLVIELPPLWSSASAEYFAGAGVALLEQLGCVHTLCYGCETPDSGLFDTICRLTGHPASANDTYEKLVSQFLKEGDHYALAREKAVLELLPDSDAAAVMDIFENPNNTLALEYQKAITRSGSDFGVHKVLRQGQGYHSLDFSDSYVSASAIRKFLAEDHSIPNRPSAGVSDIRNKPADHKLSSANPKCSPKDNPTADDPLSNVMPPHSHDLLRHYQTRYPLLFDNDCSHMLHYALLKNSLDGFTSFADCSRELSNKIRRNLDAYTCFSDFCTRLKSKDITYTRISRTFLHILLNIRKSDYDTWRSRSYVPYARVLGFRREARGLFGHLKKHSAIPLLTRAADARKLFANDPQAYAFFQKHLFADAVYRALVMEKGGQVMRNEYRQQVIIV